MPVASDNVHLKNKTSKTEVIAQCHRMSPQTFCLYNHNNKSILCLLVLTPADSWCISEAFSSLYVRIFGGHCSDFNQLELTVLSSGVRLYLSNCVVLHNDPQWGDAINRTWFQDGGGQLLTWEIYYPLYALHIITGHLRLLRSEQRSIKGV